MQGPPERYLSTRIARQVESRVVLEPGLDFDDWTILDDDPERDRDDDRDRDDRTRSMRFNVYIKN